MKRVSQPVWVIFSLVLLMVGCMSTMLSGGFEVEKDSTEQAFENVRNRASFETGCDKSQIDLVVLATSGQGSVYATQIGATGCGQRSVYSRIDYVWVLDSTARPQAPATSNSPQ